MGRGEEIPLRLASSLLLNIFETTMIVVVAFGRHPNVAVLGVFGSIPFFLLWVLGSHLLLVLFNCLSLSLILLLGLFLSAFSSSSVVAANNEVLQATHPIVQLYLTRIIDFHTVSSDSFFLVDLPSECQKCTACTWIPPLKSDHALCTLPLHAAWKLLGCLAVMPLLIATKTPDDVQKPFLFFLTTFVQPYSTPDHFFSIHTPNRHMPCSIPMYTSMFSSFSWMTFMCVPKDEPLVFALSGGFHFLGFHFNCSSPFYKFRISAPPFPCCILCCCPVLSLLLRP